MRLLEIGQPWRMPYLFDSLAELCCVLYYSYKITVKILCRPAF